MLKNLSICDLTRFSDFCYWPMRELPGEIMEKVQDASTEGVNTYAVFGKHFIPKHGEAEEWVADFTVLAEAATYCILLNRALKGELNPAAPETETEEEKS